MPVADREIPLLPQRVVGKLMFVQVLTYIAIGPIKERMHLVTPALEFDGFDPGPSLRLCPAETGEPRRRRHLAKCPLQRLLLIDAIVLLDAIEALIPKSTEARLLPRRRGIGANHLQIEPEPCGKIVYKTVGLGE